MMKTPLQGPDAKLSSDNTEELVLYSADLSPCGRRVGITLHEKGLPFDRVNLDMGNMQQRTAEYLALNPNGFVPTLVHKGHVIFESGAINQYLEEQFPDTPLMPGTPYERAQVRMWMSGEGAMAKIFRPLVYQRLAGPMLRMSRTHEEAQKIAAKSTNDPQDLSWESRVWHLDVLTPQEDWQHEDALLAWLDNVERALDGQDYLVGNFYSQADITMYPRIAMYAYVGIEISAKRFPNVTRWMAELSRRPSFDATMTKEAKQLQSMALSPFLTKVRKSLQKPEREQGFFDRLRLWVVGKIVRRLMEVDKLLEPATTLAPLYLPREADERHSFTPLTRYAPSDSNVESLLILHGDEVSPYTWRIQSLLRALGLKFSFNAVQGHNGDSLPSELIAFNPQRELPVLVHGKAIINGADTIAEYLLSAFSADGCWQPQSSGDSADARMWLALEAGNHKELTPLWQKYVCNNESVSYIADEALAMHRIQWPLGILEARLSQQAFLCGKEAGYADLAWKSRVDALCEVPAFSLEGFPAVKGWYQSMDYSGSEPVAGQPVPND